MKVLKKLRGKMVTVVLYFINEEDEKEALYGRLITIDRHGILMKDDETGYRWINLDVITEIIEGYHLDFLHLEIRKKEVGDE